MELLAGADFFTVEHLSGVACLVREETGIAARTGCDGGIVRISRLAASKADCTLLASPWWSMASSFVVG
jgi:hypothetical protein